MPQSLITSPILDASGNTKVIGVTTSGNVLSSANSSSVPLGIGATFTGTSEEVLSYATISIATFSDQASATDGLSLEFSVDGVNWDHVDVYTVLANSGKVYTLGPSARYFRVRYTNGGTAQTIFRLQTIYRIEPPKPSSHRLKDSLVTDDDAELVKAILTGEDADVSGQFLLVKAKNGRLLVDQESTTPTSTTIAQFVTNGKVYTVSKNLNMAAADTDNPLVLIKNPSASGKTLYVYATHVGVNVTNVAANFKLWYDPTITANGTVETPRNNNIGGGFGASVMNVFSLSTVSASGTLIGTYAVGQNTNTLPRIDDFSIFLAPGHNLLLTGAPGSNNRVATVTMTWAET